MPNSQLEESHTELNEEPGVASASAVNSRQAAVLMFSVFVVALCGIVYELIIASVASYLLGNSVFQFSITIGLFMFAMGIGSYITKWIEQDLIERFISIEIVVALIGGVCSATLFLIFPFHALYRPVMYGFILVIGTLVGLEIPILARILSRSATWKDSIANVLSLDYVGALVGSISFPLLMLPTIGLFQSAFAIGLLNIFVAFLTVFFFHKELKRPVWLFAMTGLVTVVLVTGLIFCERLTSFAEHQLYADKIVYRQQTPYQRIVVTENSVSGDVRLYLDKHIQFASVDEYRYHESLVHPVMSVPGDRSHVLILGGGDGLAVREVLKYPTVEKIVLVDIDPAIIEVCKTFRSIRKLNQGSLESEKLEIRNEDAFRYAIDFAGNDLERFDRIIIDLPDPHNEVLDKLYSKEFYEILRQCMTPEGVLVTQSSSPFFARDVFWCICQTLESASYDVTSYQVPMISFGIWGFNLACANGQPVEDFEIDSRMCKYLSTEEFQSLQRFGRDISRIESPTNRTFEPKLYTLYLKGLRK